MNKEETIIRREVIKALGGIIVAIIGLFGASKVGIVIGREETQNRTVQLLANNGINVEYEGSNYGEIIEKAIEKVEKVSEEKKDQENIINELKDKLRVLEEDYNSIKEEKENQIYLVSLADANSVPGTETGFSSKEFLESVKKVYIMAHVNHYTYGNSTVLPPCADKLISGDRLIARALWDLGMEDQIVGGQTIVSLPDYLEAHGFYRITEMKSLSPGDIVFMGKADGSETYSYAFVIVSYDPVTEVCYKYDMYRSTEEGVPKIEISQPFYEPIVPYSRDTCFTCAYRIK